MKYITILVENYLFGTLFYFFWGTIGETDAGGGTSTKERWEDFLLNDVLWDENILTLIFF